MKTSAVTGVTGVRGVVHNGTVTYYT
jgi:hypothetical protein